MSTFILNPGDSIVHSDTIVVKLTKMAETCQSCVKVPMTNSSDVEIVKYTFWAVVVTFLIIAVAVGVCLWHNYKKAKEIDDLKKVIIDKTNELETEKEKNEKLQAENNQLKANKPPKTNSELATELLKEISNLAKTKDSKTDEGTAEKLFELYQSIKNDFMGHEKKTD